MDAKRIIPVLDLADGRVANAEAGDPAESAGRLALAGADGILFREVTAGAQVERLAWVRAVAGSLFIPFALELPVARMADLEALLAAGADKVVLGAGGAPLLEAAAARFGRAHVSVALEAAPEVDTGTLVARMNELAQMGAGEVLLRADGVAPLGPLFQRAAQLPLAVVFRVTAIRCGWPRPCCTAPMAPPIRPGCARRPNGRRCWRARGSPSGSSAGTHTTRPGGLSRPPGWAAEVDPVPG